MSNYSELSKTNRQSLALASDMIKITRFLECGDVFIAPRHSAEGSLNNNGYKFKLVDCWTRIKIYLYFLYSSLPNFEEYLLLKSVYIENLFI